MGIMPIIELYSKRGTGVSRIIRIIYYIFTVALRVSLPSLNNKSSPK
jgi:hypothetical protein